MAEHEADWMETHRDGRFVTFRCTQCSRTIKVDQDMYDKGKAFPAVVKHA